MANLVEVALGSRRAADDLLGPVVQPGGGGAHAADHLLGEPGCLSRDCVPQLRTRGDVAESSLRLVAREHFVRELERLRARERCIDEPLQLSACVFRSADCILGNNVRLFPRPSRATAAWVP